MRNNHTVNKNKTNSLHYLWKCISYCKRDRLRYKTFDLIWTPWIGQWPLYMLGKRCGGVPNRQAFREKKKKNRVCKNNIRAEDRGEEENSSQENRRPGRGTARVKEPALSQSYLAANTQAVSPRTRQLETMPRSISWGPSCSHLSARNPRLHHARLISIPS